MTCPTIHRFIFAALMLAAANTSVPVDAQPTPRWIAGAGQAEITPPPGFPTGGHGPAGNMSRGHWTRLYARAFFFRDPSGRSLVLVSADLFAISGRIHRDVSAAFRRSQQPHGVSFGPESVIIAATHTHQGPGNYLSALIYNQFASTEAGFSRELERQLVNQIVVSIRNAIDDGFRNPTFELVLRSGVPSETLVRNRSPQVFNLNRNREELLAQLKNPQLTVQQCKAARRDGEPRDGWAIEGCPRLRAVDRHITTLEIRRNARTAAVAVFLALHPTALVTNAPLYSADVYGVASSHVASAYEGSPMVAFFNGAQGDITTRRTTRDVLDVRSLGLTLAKSIEEILRLPPLPFELTRIETRAQWVRDGAELDGARLALSPAPGVAMLGGGEDDRTPLYHLGWREGVKKVSSGEHGVKQNALDSQLFPLPKLTWLVGADLKFPDRLPLVFARLGTLSVATAPTELSTAQGAAIRDAVRDHVTQLELIGMVNEYASYTATADEYAAQDYMGASTLWGPRQGEYFAKQLAKLAAASGSWAEGRPFVFLPSLVATFGPTRAGSNRPRHDDELGAIVQSDRRLPERHLPTAVWCETYQGLRNAFARTRARRVSVIRVRDNALVDSDLGFALLTLQTESPSRLGQNAQWAAMWLRPLWELQAEMYRFRLEDLDGAPVQESAAFSGKLPAPSVIIGSCAASAAK